MAVALALLAALYLGALALAFAIAVDAVVDHAWGAVLGLVFFAVFFAVLAFVHVTKSKGLALRTTRAHPLAGDAEPVLRAVVERIAAAADLPPPRIALLY